MPRPTARRQPAHRLLRSAAALLAALALSAPFASVATAAPGTSSPPEAPPLHGWDTYRHLDEIGRLSTGVSTAQFSSFDRSGGNWQDGFDGEYSCLRESTRGCVIAEDTGAGEVQSLWFTRDGGDVSATGDIIVELDGEVVLDAPLQDVVDGELGAPFVAPFVANAQESSGGVTLKVPMPYRESMVITTSENPLFHHVSYRSFATAEGIETFDPEEIPTDVLEAAQHWGMQDPKPPARGERTARADLELAPGESVTIAEIDGSGSIGELALDLPQIVGAPVLEEVADDGRAHTGTSSFDMTIDPHNDGVVLTRRYDSISTDQKATISVDGEQVATWDGSGATPGVWVEEKVELPAEATAGKSTIHIENTFVSAGMDMSEFRYFADSIVEGERTRTDELDVGPSPAALESEAAHDYEVTDQAWEGERSYLLVPEEETWDGEAIAASDALLEGMRLQVEVDGRLTVDSPMGEFFGSGLGKADVSALMYSIDPEGEFVSWWPMPFARSATVTLVNDSDQQLSGGKARVVSTRDATMPRRLTGPHPELGYFHATSHRDEITPGEDWTFLEVEGQGRFLGVNHTMSSILDAGNVRGYLEGDERFSVDGRRTPQWHGTGSEDLYEGGWYFNAGPFSNPMNGAPASEAGGLFGCPVQCDSAYRLLIGDAIDFQAGVDLGIEPGGFSEHEALYSSTAFWYGHEGRPTMVASDEIDVGDESSEASHDYRADDTVTDLSSVFEGEADEEVVTDQVSSTNSPVSFTMEVDPQNVGVRLTRVGDQAEGYQQAEVYVDGKRAGTWSAPLGNAQQRWVEDGFTIPRELTDGASSVVVELRPLGGPSWTAARYAVHSVVPAGP